ncbi:MAG TPA: ammonia-forming cytochrome c nitrite reductase [Bacteroidales bacterium]
MKAVNQIIKEKPWMGWVIFFITMVVTFFIGLLASSIMERRTEAIIINKPKADIKAFESDNKVWGQYYKDEYQSYLQTADTSFKSKYGGSATIDMLEEAPEMVVLWAGYPFSKDYRQGRGHYYAVDDIITTLRTAAPAKPGTDPMPATCWTCKSPDVPRLMNKMGIDSFYHQKWSTFITEIKNPIGCADCHDPATMDLQITRPALLEAFKRNGKDIAKVSQQEMRSLVCAQCHVEYYFKGDGKYLTFPWDKGMDVDNIEKYYDAIEFSDWTHSISKANMIKAQHPDYEIYSMGIHAQRGLACADCHMPYKSEGGRKFTDHHIQSPLNNISNTCQICHRESEAELLRTVYERQDKIAEQKQILEKLLVKAHYEAKAAWDNGATATDMKPALTEIRHAQWRWDFAAASHGAAFHAPIEVMRIIATGIEKTQQARLILSKISAKKGIIEDIAIPDISTKANAQKAVGLDMPTLEKEKQLFLKKLKTDWK